MTTDLYKYHTNPEQLIYYDKAYEYVPHLVWEKYRSQPEEIRKREHVLARDSKIAYKYAKYILRGPFKKGEDAISKDPYIAYSYAIGVLKNRFRQGENAIFNSNLADSYYINITVKKGIEI